MRKAHLFTALSTVGAIVGLATSASAQPQLRYQADQNGDFVLFGNALGYECSTAGALPVPAPVVGTPVCNGSPGNGITDPDDSSPDIFWRSDAPADGRLARSCSVNRAFFI